MRVLSGVQPTGLPHWGNYFGAIRQYIDLQNEDAAFYFIANLHAQAFDFVHVMQRGAAYGDAANGDGHEVGGWRQRAGASHAEQHIADD